MPTIRRSSLQLSMITLLCAMIALLSAPMWAQQAPVSIGDTQITGVVDDWSHHRLIFSNPSALPADVANKITSDARYQMQQAKRSSAVTKPVVDADAVPTGVIADDAGVRAEVLLGRGPGLVGTKPKGAIKLDWTENLISTGQVQPNTYPAKFSFSTTTASCANDFVVYPTGVVGAAGAANIIAYYNLYTGGCTTGTVPSVHWAYNTGTGYAVTLSPLISADATGTQIAFIQSNGTTAELVLLKWAASTTESLTAPGTPNVAASASNYRTGTGCASPCMFTVSLSADDTFSAPYYDYGHDSIYVGDDSGKLHQIAGVFNGTTIAEVSGWPVTLNSGYKTTSPVYDNTSGYVFAGNTGALLYAVGTGNSGTTSASIHGTSGTLGGTGAAIMDAPLVDSTAGKVYAFVSNDTGGGTVSLTGCSLPSFSSTLTCTSGGFTAGDVGGTLTSSNGTINGSSITGYTSATVVTISVANGFTAISGATATLTPPESNAVYQFAVSFTGGTGTEEQVGTGAAEYWLYDGAFDNVYYSSTGGTAGDLWVMGNTGAGTGGGTLYRIPIGSGSVMSAPVAAVTGITDTSATHYAWPSPITEYCNQTSVSTPCGASGGATTGGTDYLFFSVDRVASATGTNACGTGSGNGCLLVYSIETPTNTPTRVSGAPFTTIGTPGCWVTGGIIIDNSVTTTTGASQIYTMELNGNGAGGPTPGSYTSTACTGNNDTHTPIAFQGAQANP